MSAIYKALRTVIPQPEDRVPVTLLTAVHAGFAYLPLIILAYLARRPNTYVLRLLILPIAVLPLIRIAFGTMWTIPSLNVYNWGQCLLVEVLVAKAIDFAFTKEGMLKNNEKVLSQNASFAETLRSACELLCTGRGLAFKFGAGTRNPALDRPQSRKPFLWATFRSFIRNYLLLDFLETLIKLFPGVGTPAGGTMFYPSLALPERLFVSTLIHMLTGCCLLAGFGMVFDLCTFLAVAVVNSSPSAWPPVMDNPWVADSLHVLWSVHWHQLLRRTFFVLGGLPGYYIAGSFGMLFGTFLASGLFHETSIYAMGRGFDPQPVIFFTLQAPLMIGERIWRQVTGRRVGGPLGRAWVYFVCFILSQPMIDSWHRRGLGGGMVIPPFISPTRLVLVPVMQLIVDIVRRS